ncbi:MAG: response regulator [Candidatus Zixiibacteriota bacterium]|nr:MAG: response regulator [candidate division Zixibacteria bacterium]HDL04718.1 response regulator [candidate division Zixibacteria bacterium]
MKRKNILIVDDEPDVVVYLSEVLESSNIDIYSADNAEAGWKLAGEVHLDLICLDIMMPGESGLSMYTRLRRTPDLKDIPVIIISGVEQEQEFDFRKFVDDEKTPPPEYYFEKPINVDDFVAVVERLLSMKEKRKKKGHSS